ncbi:MAG: hypothetical protein ABIF10_08025 [Candidatus Woesearchaeota archaeon]
MAETEGLEQRVKVSAAGWVMLAAAAFGALNACPYEAYGQRKEAEATAKQYISRNGKYAMPLNVAEKEIVFKFGTIKELQIYNIKTLYNSAEGKWTVMIFPNPNLIKPLTELPTHGRELFSKYNVEDKLAQIIIEWGPKEYNLEKEWQIYEEGISKERIKWQGESPLPILVGGKRAFTKRYVLQTRSDHIQSFLLHHRNRRYNITLIFPETFNYPKDMEEAVFGLQFK